MLSAVLTQEGYDVAAFGDGESAFANGPVADSTTVLLDVGLPGADGVVHCRRLRREGHAGGVLMLTARHEIGDRVTGLDAGADDYLVKPFALDELLARVRVLVRRSTGLRDTAHHGSTLTVAELSVDPETRRASVDGVLIDLTRIEFNLLHLLVENAPVVLTRDVIHERIWGYEDDLGSNTLEVFISQLRRKLEIDGTPRRIHTVRGVGYVVRDEP